jgi:hypothetical protein
MIELAKEVESEDPIEWEYLNIDEDTAYKLIGLNVFEMYNDWKSSGQSEDIMLVTITKLIVENFALNLKLQREQ